MIPVTLRLKNFLSYGTAAEALDFESFSVACLSGANGQGKSALLDAVTWAVWGEARKSSESRKPDDELLRIGAREMEVELVFDLEGTRYRIVRAYHRSATGKTSKPGLEFHVLDPEAGEFRALTAESVRATQAVIDARMGIDYDTFINSAFLLQGRSDEFTRKKPGERKEILGKILGLDRYGRLAAAAGQRYGDARERAKRHGGEVERLKAALEDEGRWREERDATAAALGALTTERDRLRAEEAALRERLAALDATARDAERLRDALRRTDEKQLKLDAEAADLAGRIGAAEALVARADAIEAAFERHEALYRERKALDEKANQQRGIEHLLNQKTNERDRRRMEIEGQLTRLRAEVEAGEVRLDDDARRLSDRPRVEDALERAVAAEQAYEALKAQEAAHRALAERIAQVDERINHARGHLKGTLATLRAQLRDAEAAIVPVEALREEEARLAETATQVATWQEEQEGVREEGTTIKEQLAAVEADRARLAKEIAGLEAKRARIRSTDEEECPTCGTRLTEGHRRHVEATYDREREALLAPRAALEEKVAALEAARDGLRRRFVDLRTRIEHTNGAAMKLVQVRDRLARWEEEQDALARQRARADAIERELAEETYEPRDRAERLRLQERLDAEPFDAERYERARAEAARAEPLREQKAALDEVAARHDTLARRLHQQRDEAARLRADLDAGTSLAPIQRQVEALKAQLQSVGYDGARHEAVGRELEALAEAPREHTRLHEAQRSLTDWTRRRALLATEQAALEQEAAEYRETLAAAEARLEGRAALEREHAEEVRACGEVEARCSAAQSRLGALEERLERCASDREALKAAREAHREARREATLYRHLRGAFGRHGIPSLIIEETLPEIEDRANALLERLSNGRTRVALETLADKKAGGTKETLDIRITDDQGVARPYETYSGGEAFRVNFALRIALAQLLAERAGVRIRTLVVDEGFGTQDKEGIQNLVEAIRTIQDDFDKILVITHLDELKDAFPIRIEVTKRPVEGSTFEVVGV